MKFEFSRQTFEKKLTYQVPSKSIQWETSCSMRTGGGRTDKMKLIVDFRNIANAPEDGDAAYI
jgi:hypothetical protein